MRFDENNKYTENLSEGVSPHLNYDNFLLSLKTNFIYFLNEDYNFLFVI
jgi:hypothetical protein